MSLDDITARIRHWLKKNDLPLDGVKIVFEFPDQETAYRTEKCIKQEIEPMLAYQATGGTFGAIETMNGLGLSLRVAPVKRG